MGLSYTSSVFFGTYIPSDSPIGQRLRKYIDRQGGTPAATSTPKVVINECGSQGCGPMFATVQIADVKLRASRFDEIG